MKNNEIITKISKLKTTLMFCQPLLIISLYHDFAARFERSGVNFAKFTAKTKIPS